jgi:hypothetical protein
MPSQRQEGAGRYATLPFGKATGKDNRCAYTAADMLKLMKRVIILGPGGSGNSTLAVRLGEITGLPVIELDKLFWRPGLVATPREHWVATQTTLVQGSEWSPG